VPLPDPPLPPDLAMPRALRVAPINSTKIRKIFETTRFILVFLLVCYLYTYEYYLLYCEVRSEECGVRNVYIFEEGEVLVE
jgi:hypothetical protein